MQGVMEYDTRKSDDQPLIDRVAELFLTAKQKQLIQSLNGGALSWSRGDLKRLESRSPSVMTGEAGAAYRALFNFGFTIDKYLSYLRELEFRLRNQQLIDGLTKAQFDHDIIAPDFRLWCSHDLAPWAGGHVAGKTGPSLGMKRHAKGLKSNTDLHFDEMFLLTFKPLRMLAALAQGLFLDGANYCNKGMKDKLAAKEINITRFADASKLEEKDNEPYFINEPGVRQWIKEGVDARVYDDLGVGNGGPIGHYDVDNSNVNWKAVIAEMGTDLGKDKPNPMRFCPKLSDAFIESGVIHKLNGLYYDLQNEYMQKRPTTTMGMYPHNPVDMLSYKNRIDNYSGAFSCGPGMTPRFVGYDGQDVKLRDAIIERNGRQYINTGMVDPDRSYCTATIPVTQMGRFSALLSQPFPDAWTERGGIRSTAPIPFEAKAMLLSERGGGGGAVGIPQGAPLPGGDAPLPFLPGSAGPPMSEPPMMEYVAPMAARLRGRKKKKGKKRGSKKGGGSGTPKRRRRKGSKKGKKKMYHQY